MDRVGGFVNYLALLGDASAYDDVMTALEGESDAAKIRKVERDREQARVRTHRGRR